MNPDIPQEVRIVNAIAEQLFDVWPVSIVMIDLEDCIWRVNKQMSDELQLDADVIGKPVVDMLEVVQDKENVLPRYLRELHEDRQRIMRFIETLCLGAAAVGCRTESMHGAGSPQAQRIMISRQGNLNAKKELAKAIAHIEE